MPFRIKTTLKAVLICSALTGASALHAANMSNDDYKAAKDRIDSFIAKNTVLFWLGVALVVTVVIVAVRRRRRARYNLGKTNGVPPAEGVTDSIGTP